MGIQTGIQTATTKFSDRLKHNFLYFHGIEVGQLFQNAYHVYCLKSELKVNAVTPQCRLTSVKQYTEWSNTLYCYYTVLLQSSNSN